MTLSKILKAVRREASISVLLEEYAKNIGNIHSTGDALELEGPEGALEAILLYLFRLSNGSVPALAVVPSEQEAEALAADLTILCNNQEKSAKIMPLRIFPWWGTLPYQDGTSLRAVLGERTAALTELIMGPALLIVPQRSFLTPLPPPDYFSSKLIPVKIGETIDTIALTSILTDFGYTRVPRVQLYGEYALKGEVLDILLGPGEDAYRILFDYNRVESIKRFNPEDSSQISTKEKIHCLLIRPQKEVLWNTDTLSALERNLLLLPEFKKNKTTTLKMIEDLGIQQTKSGEELFFSLAFENKKYSILDYLPQNCPVFFLNRERLEHAQKTLESEYSGLFRKAIKEKPVPAPQEILLNFNDLALKAEQHYYTLSFMSIRSGEKKRRVISCDPARSFFGNLNYLKEDFSSLLEQGWTIIVTAESEVQAQRIRQLLNFGASENADKQMLFSVLPFPLSAGFSLPGIKLMLVEESEIFGRRRRIPRSLGRVKSSPIDTFVELNPGDYVVHVHYGIGHFKGIERIHALGHERDYVRIEYYDEESILVPIEQVNLVQRYIGSDGEAPRLDKIGSKSWESRKNRVKNAVEDIAQ